jgi:hypothetical protein
VGAMVFNYQPKKKKKKESKDIARTFAHTTDIDYINLEMKKDRLFDRSF